MQVLVLWECVPGDPFVAIVVHLAGVYYFLELTETGLRHENQVCPHHVAQIELLRVREGYIFYGVLCQDKVLVRLKRRQETQPVLPKGFDDLLQMLRFKVIERF